MSLENSKRDNNYVTTLLGVDMTTGLLPTKVYVDESTHRLLVSSVITSMPAVTVDTTGLATSTKQSDGSQKTQVVDGSGNVIGATSNALDVNIKSGASAGTQYTEDAAAAADPVGNMLITRRKDTLSATEVSADGDNIALNSTNKGQLHVKLADTITVDGSGVTQPVSAASLPLPSGAATSAKQLADNHNVIVTSAPTTAVTGTFWQATQPVSLASVPSHAVTNAGTFAVQAAEADGANVTLGAKADAKSTATDTTAISAMSVLKQISASVQAPPSQAVTNAGTFAVQSAATLAAETTKVIGTVRTADGAGNLYTSNSTTYTAKFAQDTNLLGTLGTAFSTAGKVDIKGADGDVFVRQATGSNLHTVVDSGTITTVSTLTALTGGGVAHDGVDSGNPVKVGARAVSTLATSTLVSAADRTDNISDLDGTQIVRPQFPLGDLLSDATSNTDGASTASGIFTAVASTKNYITSFQIFRTDSGSTPIYIDFRDGTAGAVLWRAVIPPNGGSNSPSASTPLFKTSANTALAYDVSAATTTVYINVSGFQSKT